MSLFELGFLGLDAEERKKRAAWANATPIPGYDDAIYRRDRFGWAMRWSDHGDRSSEYGWEIDHVTPVALGGTDDPWNLAALHCRNNASLGGLLGSARKGLLAG
jgi:hypothetical protein